MINYIIIVYKIPEAHPQKYSLLKKIIIYGFTAYPQKNCTFLYYSKAIYYYYIHFSSYTEKIL